MDFIRDEDFEKKEKELYELVTSAVAFRQSQRDAEYINNEAHYEGLQWELAENKVDSPFLLRSDINHLKNAVDIRLGSLCAEKYWGELKPLSPSDVESIENLNVLYKNEWNRLNADDYVEYVLRNGAIFDNGYVLINFDTSKIVGGTNTKREGTIVLEPLETTNVYLDPSATNIDACEYIVVKSRKSKLWIKSNKPDWLNTIKELDIKEGIASPNDSGDILVGRDYGKASSKMFDVYTMYKKEVEEREIELEDTENKKVKDTVRTVRIKEYYFIGEHLIDINEKYPFDEFPVIPFQWQSVPQSPYGMPLLRGLTIPQKVANLIESAANNIAMHYTVPSWLISAESGINITKFAKLNNALGMAWKVNGDVSKAVKQMDPPQINKDLVAIKDSFVDNIKLYAGATDTYIGAIGTAGATAEGTVSAINRATVIDNPVIKQIEKFVEKLSRMIVKFMVRYYKDQEVYIRDTDPRKNNTYDFKSITVDKNFENIKYEFFVDLASRSKTDKNRQYNLMKELYTIQNQYKEDKRIINIPDLVKAANLDNYNEMYKRFSDMSEEAFAEKADLIVQILQIGQTITPNGTPLISAEDMQEGIMDVLDDNGDLSTVQEIFNVYEQYQTQITELNNQLAAAEQQAEAEEFTQAADDQTALINQLIQGRDNILINGLPELNDKEVS